MVLLYLTSLLNVPGDGVGDEFVDDLLEVGGADLPGDDVDHLLTDVPDLLGLGIASFLGGQVLLTSEPNAEHTEQVTIGRLKLLLQIKL